MQQIGTITSKRQLTIPSNIFKQFALKKGQKVTISVEKDVIKIEPACKLVDSLAGSISLPKKFKKMSTKELINFAKLEHFSQKYKNK